MAVTTPTSSARARSAVHRQARRRASHAVPSVAATPISFAQYGWAPPSAKAGASTSVQSGAVEPPTGTPGL